MNRRGFMMAELVVVSAIVLVTIVGFYTSYNKIYSAYKTRLNYYDVTTLYRLGYYRNILNENDVLDDTMSNSLSNYATLVYNSNTGAGNVFSLDSTERLSNISDIVYLVNNNKSAIDKSKFSDLHETFYEYIDFFNNAVDYTEFSYVMIMERCMVDDIGNVDIDDCNYAYLEIVESTEAS